MQTMTCFANKLFIMRAVILFNFTQIKRAMRPFYFL